MEEIRVLEELDLLDQVVGIQLAVWGEEELCPRNQLKAIATSGGATVGAVRDGKVVGFAMGWPGIDGRGLYLHSHMLAVLPGEQGSGLGSALKWAQREWALASGFKRMKWTYDPFRYVNARLNIERLGAVPVSFIPNCYGTMNDRLNHGLPSDRFVVEWRLDAPEVAARRDGSYRPAPVPSSDRLPFPRDLSAEREMDLAGLLVRRREFAEKAAALFAGGLRVVAIDHDGPAYLFAGRAEE